MQLCNCRNNYQIRLMTQEKIWPHVLGLTESGLVLGFGPEAQETVGQVLMVVLG